GIRKRPRNIIARLLSPTPAAAPSTAGCFAWTSHRPARLAEPGGGGQRIRASPCRRLERPRMSEVDRARDAFAAIPCPDDRDSWWPIIGSALDEGISEDEILLWCERGPKFHRAEVLATI